MRTASPLENEPYICRDWARAIVGTPTTAVYRQQGAMAVEFALVLPILLTATYAIIAYSLLFALQQQLTHAATEGARAALRYPASVTRASAAETTARQALGWLSDAQAAVLEVEVEQVTANCPTQAECLRVTLRYPYAANPLVPALMLPYPTTVGSAATVQVDDIVL
ncbi:TadE/TadG family type IV pilus assembly protein [Chitiniphilus eburneus]|uniref:Pilus assembly protein n=1 Tax=Chitiniphilus eburneus TaxID=2571148 RepID=A0A4U0PK64_9NEIS|nr:TadE family protein [Chitiniphilus eburneus]TJZ68359.1 pilus assembly protein [Chitiniphilus eburneus]